MDTLFTIMALAGFILQGWCIPQTVLLMSPKLSSVGYVAEIQAVAFGLMFPFFFLQ